MLLALLLALPALAEEPPPEEEEDGGWIDLEAEADFGSALDAQPSEATGRPLRGRFAFRPVLAVQELSGTWGPSAGGSLSHQWWSLRPGRLAPVGETRLRATASFGAMRGHDLALESTHGAWVGDSPAVALLVGPELRFDCLSSDSGELPTALTLGPQARLALRLGPLTPWTSVTPTWTLYGERLDLDAPWHGLTMAAGLAWDARPLSLRLSGSQHDSGEATARTLTLGLHLRLL